MLPTYYTHWNLTCFTAASSEYLWRQLMLIHCFLFLSLFPFQAPDCSDWSTWLRSSFSNVQPNDNMHKLMECMFVQSKTYLNRNTVKYTLESILHHLYINLCRPLTQASLHAWALGVISNTTPINIGVDEIKCGLRSNVYTHTHTFKFKRNLRCKSLSNVL